MILLTPFTLLMFSFSPSSIKVYPISNDLTTCSSSANIAGQSLLYTLPSITSSITICNDKFNAAACFSNRFISSSSCSGCFILLASEKVRYGYILIRATKFFIERCDDSLFNIRPTWQYFR